MISDTAVEPYPEEAVPLRRPLRVLVCPDRPDWAFHNIATNIVRYAPDDVDVSVQFMDGPSETNLGALVETMMLKDVDIVHTFWREDMFELLRPEALIRIAGGLRIDVDDLVGMISSRALTTSVYDHLHSSEDALRARAVGYHMIEGYTVSSNRLDRLYRAHAFLPRPDAVIPDGVDLAMFTPAPDGGQRDAGAALRIGWVGNSAWGQSQGGDPKGYHRLFEPAMALLGQRGMAVDVRRADPQIRRIPFEQMPQFYRELDVLVCTSAAEGTPNPVLEAMASGVAVVSTDVGIVRDALGPLQARLVLQEATPTALADALATLSGDAGLLGSLKAENRIRAADWSWEECVRPWWPFWRAAQRRANDPRASGRRREALFQSCIAYYNHVKLNGPPGGLVKGLQARLGRFVRGQ